MAQRTIEKLCKILDTSILNPKQQRIYEWINDKLQLPVYAEVFRGAAVFLNQRPPGYVTFVAHAGREIMNGLARTFRGDVRQQVQYVEHLNKIAADWNDNWGTSIGASGSEDLSYHEIPNAVCVMLQELIDDHRKGRIRSKESDEIFFLTFLRYVDRDNIPINIMREWKNSKRWFQEYAHVGRGIFGPEVKTQIEAHFLFLESMLDVSANSQYEQIKRIDEILEETNG